MKPKGTNNRTANVLRILCSILLYYPFSIGLTFYQQWFIRIFQFPLFVVLCHYLVKFIASTVLRKASSCCFHRSHITLEWRDYLTKVAATGVAASIDIGLSNWSFQYITVSLYTMAKSSCIVFILLFAVILSLERCKWSVVSVVSLIACGLILFTYKATQFDLFGFTLVELAAFFAGMRWATCQMLMQRKEIGLHNPIDLIFHVQPWMILSIIPLVFAFEASHLAELGAVNILNVVHLIVIGGFLGFFMELAEYLLISYTSSLTLNICGVAKELVTLTLAHFFKHDVLSEVNFLGLIICVCGIALHVYVKTKSSSEDDESKHAHDSSSDLQQRLLLENDDIDE